MSLETAYADLLASLAANDAAGVQDAVFRLGAIHSDSSQVSDHVVERLLTLLRSERMYVSALAGHVLNFFEFEGPQLSDRAKLLCIGFLKAHGDEFSHVHSRQVVAELRAGAYLK
jgi:hypothetical protein